MKSLIKKGELLQDSLIGKKIEESKKENLEAFLFISGLLLSLPIITVLLLLFLELK